MYICDLGKNWQLRHEELHCNKDHYAILTNRKDGWFEVEALPCDVHVPLIKAGIIEDPVVADNCFKSEWIEQKSWWFKKTFKADEELLRSQNSELVIEGLDVHADLFLNGVYLGHHLSAMYPFRQDVRGLLKDGENVLVVRVTSGLEYYNDLDLSKIRQFISCEHKRGRSTSGDDRRVFVRKPQYVYGWDWNPRIATCGIMGNARIEAYNDVAIRNARFTTDQLLENSAQVSVEVEIDNIRLISTLDITVQVDFSFNGTLIQSAQKEVFATSGLNYVLFSLTLEHPKLWWPNGMGEQHLYTVQISARTSKGGTDRYEFKTGIRTVNLNTDKIDPNNRRFAFEINGKRVFSKGANWETPDSIYGRITNDKYETLVRVAKEANFNFFRINGCNAYERNYLYECCDRYGILVWQDFAFSCAAYPDELDWFRHEVAKEVDYQTRRLRNHPCMALWCGNNESQHILWDTDGKKPASPRGALLYNYIMPDIVRNNSPHIPYWNSSPYGGETDMESDAYGDKHLWVFMSNDVNERINPEEYDKVACKFVSEFGCIGPGRLSSIQKYFGENKIEVNSKLWQMHTNPFNTYFYSVNRPVPQNDTLAAGIKKHYTDSRELSIEKCLFYGGLFQGLMLGYACESMRCAEHNSGSFIWSYNDAWGEIGWSIVDYYLTRKIAYYFVKRAFEHKKLVMRQKDGIIRIFGLNDTHQLLKLDLEYGYITFDGDRIDITRQAVTVPPFTKSTVIAQIPKGAHDLRKGVYYAVATNQPALIPATLRMADFRSLQLSRPELSVTDIQRSDDTVSFTVSSDKYVHAVHFGFDDRICLSDEYFDLLPNESRRITVETGGFPLDAGNIRAYYAEPMMNEDIQR